MNCSWLFYCIPFLAFISTLEFESKSINEPIPSIPVDTIDNYQIYIDDKMVLARSEYGLPNRDTIHLDEGNALSVLYVTYNHCTHMPGERRIMLRNGINGVQLANLVFPAKTSDIPMRISIADIWKNQLVNPSIGIRLEYFDSQLPASGKLLVILKLKG